ncbi:MAG: periplasmic heavy metal sensor [Gemmatimonadales bacterium]|nr:periplasmic heavy metal sensor [Gemmatimonadales bacterium]NIN10646.1 periplasmic heavy metal sensor [Gemmatimonadales bacterium]NIN49408.1 periplasmic heavy metal sensor [Gemmatimonadales bacterium]NIP06872.1 periplasmic heavy metal sensor [Gemmatimonadales bacterium]NIR01546.1 periplasmic heavy metal sensor [Gemmatimonadales bacterium]
MFDRSKAKAASLLVAIFVLGVAVGGAALAAWGDNDPGRSRRPRERVSYTERLRQELSLTTAQRESVEAILERSQESMQQYWREVGPRFDTLRAQVRTEIMAVLSEEQQEAFQQLMARSDSARRYRDRRGEPHSRVRRDSRGDSHEQ